MLKWKLIKTQRRKEKMQKAKTLETVKRGSITLANIVGVYLLYTKTTFQKTNKKYVEIGVL